jgi:starch-binding outer membrane protein, SusD/RagB family
MENTMKKNRMIKYLMGLVVAGITVGCTKDFIERPPVDTIVDVNFYQTPEQLLAASAPLYNLVWFAYNDKASHGIGDGRGGTFSANYSYQLENIQFRTTGVTQENANSWRAFFNVVGQANALINNVNKYTPESVPSDVKEHVIAEARFMRGLAYSFLVMNYGPVPLLTDNVAVLQDTTVSRNTEESVWEFICRDLRYGTTHLPESPVKVGRVTSWSAKAMLAKMYLTRAGLGRTVGNRDQTYLDSAKVLAKEVVDSKVYELVKEYEDLFKTANNNNPETVFALQWVYNGSNWGSQNSVQAFLAFSGSITGFSDGWGGDLGASLYMLSQYEGLVELNPDNTAVGFKSTKDKRLRGTFMMPGAHYDYITNQVLNEAGVPEKEPLVVPTGSGGFNSRAWVKKYVVGRPEDNAGKVLQQRTEVQTYMLRYADVLLVLAEAIMGNSTSTGDADALAAYNAVRERAGLAPKTIITWDDIFKERQVELAMEGQIWYDYVRLSYYDDLRAYKLLKEQHRGFTKITPDDTENATAWKVEEDTGSNVPDYYDVNSGNFRLPYPEAELDKAPNLKKAPVPYEFN